MARRRAVAQHARQLPPRSDAVSGLARESGAASRCSTRITPTCSPISRTRSRREAKATSTSRLLSSLKRFYQYALRQNRIAADPSLNIDSPKLPRGLPKTLTEDDVEKLLAAPNVEDALGLRDRTMLEMLYASGLRVSELVTLKVPQVSQDMGVVRMLGKGSKERLVPLGEEALAWITRYLKEARPRILGKRAATRCSSRRAAAR